MSKLYSSIVILIFSILFYNSTVAQTKKGEYINASLGLGLCAPNDDVDITGSGFYAQGEYIWNVLSWFGLRPYAGVVIASGNSDVPGNGAIQR